MAYFMGKEGFVWWQGVVEDRHDPLYLGRCKIRVLGWHSENKNDMPTISLPWAYPVAPITSASQTGVGTSPLGPVEGTWVVGFYRDGEAGQEPMFFGTLGGIPELDAKGVNNDGTAVGGQGFLDPRLDRGDIEPGADVGHPEFKDEIGPRTLQYNPASDMVPREPASIIHNANPDPTEDVQTVKISANTTLTEKTEVRSLIGRTGTKSPTPPFTVKVVEQPIRSTYPDTGLADSTISTTRNLDYLKEPTTNRLARGIRGNTDKSDPRISGIVFEKMQNRKVGQMEIPTSDGKAWSEPKVPWAAVYPYNHVHQTESGHVIEMDDTPNEERLHWYHRTGTFTEIHPVGIKVDKIVNNYYNIILGAKYTHIEAGDYTTVDGSQENYILGNRVDKIDGDYSIAIKRGRFNVNNPKGAINLESSKMTMSASESLTLSANNVIIENKSADTSTIGDDKKKVGGKYSVHSGAYSLNAQGSLGLQSGGGMTLNITDSVNESIFGVLPSMTLGYAKKTTATLGKIGMECTDNLLSGAVEMNLGLAGAGASVAVKPIGDIELNSNLGTTGIKGTALLGNIDFSSIAGNAQMSSLLSTLKLEASGAASMQGLLGEVTVSSTGKVKVKGLIASLAEILNELIDIVVEHTHPTGTGPSGPPMPPASVKLPLLQSLKIGQSLE
tara:strand:- start:652 stop:2658 length:2007 start_codon:yes stop_codon:yes gene_type:complete